MVVSGSEDHTVRVWRIADGACLHTLHGHTSTIRAVCALPGGRVDSASEIRAHDPDPRSRGVNAGLGVRTSEASSNAACREIAKRKGLTPADGGAYRSVP